MRPDVLYPLFADVASLDGVGPKLAKLIARAAGPRVLDLLWHRPFALIDRRYRPHVAEAEDGRLATIKVRVLEHLKPAHPKRPYRVICEDATGTLMLIFFNPRQAWLNEVLPEGHERWVSGEVRHYGAEIQMTHPDRIVPPERLGELDQVEPVYPTTAGLGQRVLAKAAAQALDRLPPLAEWQDAAWLSRQAWPGFGESLHDLHHPHQLEDLGPKTPFRRRLAFDEILASQVALALVRQRARRQPGQSLVGDGTLRAKIKAATPFAPTGAQEVAAAEIAADLSGPDRMLRLLQGDVGAGKTWVALQALAVAVEAGAQGALMAPTEILARQHAASLAPYAAAAGLRLAVLTGRDKGRAREAILDQVASGAIDVLIGTHALIEDEVLFKNLGLVVVDEQHRFGVHQRLALGAKGQGVHMLVMTATPIPRSLTLAYYGDLDVSRLTDKPKGRTPITTRALPLERLDEVVEAVGRAVGDQRQVYWVCPLVEESDKIDAAAAEERYASLAARFGADKVGLIHGRMKAPDKDKVMAAFQDGSLSILVATTVIEVGVDVPNASIMVIEHAERFGLAQLHQLRGRVGRGAIASTCLLLYQTPLGETARARIAMLRDSEDGFRIAEEDLRLRGAGEVLGTRQSGMPTFKIADLTSDGDLLAAARDDARLILDRDPNLTSPRGQALRLMLYLFERDAAIGNLRAG